MRSVDEAGQGLTGLDHPPEPVSAFELATSEARRRDWVKQLGPCRTGCQELDDHVLLGGGLERGSVVGISADEEDDFGMVLACQIVSNALLEGVVSVLFITPKPTSIVLAPITNGITAALNAKGKLDPQDLTKKRIECLDRIMLSRVFDVDGFCEVLADLDRPGSEVGKRSVNTSDEGVASSSDSSRSTGQGRRIDVSESLSRASPTSEMQSSPANEIEASQHATEEEDILGQEAQPKASKGTTVRQALSNHTTTRKHVDEHDDHSQGHSVKRPRRAPDIIIITHFSSILTSLFTQRENSAAHSMTQLMASRLRHLSKTSRSQPLIILLNSTDFIHTNLDTSAESRPMTLSPSSHIATDKAAEQAARIKAIDPTLRSIFRSSSSFCELFSSRGGRNPQVQITKRPSFGLVFAQLVDLHLLCSKVARTMRGAGQASISGFAPLQRHMTFVEVLFDELGLWEGRWGKRKSREQKWATLHVVGARIVHAHIIKDGGRQ